MIKQCWKNFLTHVKPHLVGSNNEYCITGISCFFLIWKFEMTVTVFRMVPYMAMVLQ